MEVEFAVNPTTIPTIVISRKMDLTSVLNNTLIAVSRQPSAVSRQPSAVSRQPSAVSRQPSAVSRQPSAVS